MIGRRPLTGAERREVLRLHPLTGRPLLDTDTDTDTVGVLRVIHDHKVTVPREWPPHRFMLRAWLRPPGGGPEWSARLPAVQART